MREVGYKLYEISEGEYFWRKIVHAMVGFCIGAIFSLAVMLIAII